MQPIHTINSRSHIMLEILRDHFGVTGERMMQEIQMMHAELVRILAAKNIDYASLRSGLVPSLDRQEAVFIFDSQATGSEMYGPDVFKLLLPLLDPRTTQSILVGDLLGDDQRLIFEILNESMVLARTFAYWHSTMLYGVYINNLSDAALERLHQGLGSSKAYLGYIPTTFMSRAKIYISTSMAGFLLKKDTILIMAHEDDRSNTENANITLYDLEQHGYKVASLQSSYFDIFLKYKIERPVFKGDEIDVQISLNAITGNVQPLVQFNVILDEAKHGYLINEKLGKLKMAGLDKVDRRQIEAIIQAKVSESYIYNLMCLVQHNVMKFNIMLELGRSDGYPTRLNASLEYMPENKTLRIITLH